MSDLAPLHRRLRRALVLATMIPALPACTAGGSGSDPQAQPPKKVEGVDAGNQVEPPQVEPPEPEPPEPEPPTTAIAIVDDPPIPPPEGLNFPPCPSGAWCGPKALVEPLRRTDLPTLPADVEGCPGALQGNNEIDESKFADHPGLPLHGAMLADIDPLATKAKRAAGEPDTCCYGWLELCPGGRPALVAGRPVIATLRAGDDWSADLPALTIEPPASLRSRVADEWLRDALSEHASIASFERARLELAAIGAPASLLAACERAAADEVVHARLCFGLAAQIGARSLAPDPLPELGPRGGDAITVALDTFVEGCVGETIAAACVRRAASLAADPVVRGVLERIADDETEHAALAWRTIAWLVEREGPSLLVALRERAESMRFAGFDELDSIAEDPQAAQLHAQGRLDRRELARVRGQVWRELIDPLLAELAAEPRAEPRSAIANPSDSARC